MTPHTAGLIVRPRTEATSFPASIFLLSASPPFSSLYFLIYAADFPLSNAFSSSLVGHVKRHCRLPTVPTLIKPVFTSKASFFETPSTAFHPFVEGTRCAVG